MSARARSARYRAALLAMGVIGGMALGPALAWSNPAKRVAAFRRLPDWSGIWLSDAEQPDAGGQYTDISRFDFSFGRPPYNAEWAANLQKAAKALAEEGEAKSCEQDFPSVMQHPQPFELTVTPEETLLTAGDGAIRHIFTDGRRHPQGEDLEPSRMGDSIGRWDADVLVVDTVGRRAGPSLFGQLAFSPAAHFKERIRRTGRDTLEDRMVVEDPVALTGPWAVTLKFSRATFLDRLIPYECDRTDRIRIVDGKGQIAPP